MRHVSAVVCLLATISAPALAHELSCRTTFNGERSLVIDSYPATIEVRVSVKNEHPDSVSEALEVNGELLPADLFATPFGLPVGESQAQTFSILIDSYEACAQLAGTDYLAPYHLLSTVEVVWDQGAAQCSAELICRPAVCK